MAPEKEIDERVVKHDALIPVIFKVITQIQADLKEHVEWEQNKYDEMNKSNEQKHAEMDKSNQSKFAGIWVESWVKAIGFGTIMLIIGAVIGIIFK